MKGMFYFFCLVVAGFVAWTYLTQPMFMGNPDERRAPAVNPEALKAHVELITGALSPRDHEHLDQLDAVASYIRANFQESGARVTDQPFDISERLGNPMLVKHGLFKNVIASYGPVDGERIIVGAHYDAYDRFPGADDNASGVAGLLELGRLLGSTPTPLRVDLVAWTLEEPPHFGTPDMGSVIHTASLIKEGAKVRAVISLEMIGYFSGELNSQTYPTPLLKFFYPWRGDFIAIVGGMDTRAITGRIKRSIKETLPLPVASLNAPMHLAGIDLSDHRSYAQFGFPAVMITDTAMYRNPNYHSARDTAATLDYGRMADVVRGVYVALQDLSHD